MATKVSVITNPGNRISISRPTNKVSINKTTTQLQGLTDVDVSGRQNNDVLVYDEASGKFVSKVIPIVDGGNF
jgi:hypothetical protein